jgi:hypothetical protein
VLERSVYVPALNDASFNGGDDFLGSARERLFGFINGQTGVNNPQAQGFQHLAKDRMVSQDASLGDTAFINALRNGGDLLNVFGDFPTLSDPRHADANSPLWDAQPAPLRPRFTAIVAARHAPGQSACFSSRRARAKAANMATKCESLSVWPTADSASPHARAGPGPAISPQSPPPVVQQPSPGRRGTPGQPRRVFGMSAGRRS